MKPTIEDVEYVEIDAKSIPNDIHNKACYANHILMIERIEDRVTVMRDALREAPRAVAKSGLRMELQFNLFVMQMKLLEKLNDVIHLIQSNGVILLAETLYDNAELTDEEFAQEWLAGHRAPENGTIDDLPFWPWDSITG